MDTEAVKMLGEILKSTQDFMKEFGKTKEKENSEEEKSAELYCKLNSVIQEFEFDLDKGKTFASWFEKHKSFFENEGNSLAENVKVRLLVAKLGGSEYAKISQKLMPQKLDSMRFDILIQELENEFGDPRSKIVKRFEVIKLRCPCVEKVLDFGAVVNSECEKAEMALTVEDSKILIFIAGIPEEANDLRQICLRFVERHSNSDQCTFKQLLEECRSYLATKADAKVFENIQEKVKFEPDYSFEVNNVSKNPIQAQSIQNSKMKNENSEDRFRGSNYQKKFNYNSGNQRFNNYSDYSESQNKFRDIQCYNCGRLGHYGRDCRKPKGWLNRFNRPQINHVSIDPDSSGTFCGITDIVNPNSILIKQKWITQKVKLNEKLVEMIVDSASQINILNEEIWSKIGSPELFKVDYSGVGLGKTKFEIEGKFKAIVELFGTTSEEEFHLVKGDVNILGLPILNKFGTNSRILAKFIPKEVFNSPKQKKWRSPQPFLKNEESPFWKKKIFKNEETPKRWHKRSRFANNEEVLVKNTNKNGKTLWLPGKLVNKVGQKWRIEVPRLKCIVSREEWHIRKKYWLEKNQSDSDNSIDEKSLKLNQLFKKNINSKHEDDSNVQEENNSENIPEDNSIDVLDEPKPIDEKNEDDKEMSGISIDA
uniref:CCHC-type domain-containing protein n=1 Tax=Meloidogyne enterolobii TaxID=390850 RepID=A0A6V7X108_MELEN|nr:unnamed protein product [Meloidogyne enterolobii]